MKRIIMVVSLVVILTIGICFWQFKENEKIDAEAVTLKEDLSIAFGKNAKVSDFIEKLKGTLVENVTINTEKLGENQVSFDYINVKNKRKTFEFSITVKDENSPQIFSGSSYTINVGDNKDLTEVLLSR